MQTYGSLINHFLFIQKYFAYTVYTELYIQLEYWEAFKKKKTAIIVTLSLSHLTPTLRKEIGTVNIGTISWISDHPPSPLW